MRAWESSGTAFGGYRCIYSPRKKLHKGWTAKRHCKAAFMKHVFPTLSRPHTPGHTKR